SRLGSSRCGGSRLCGPRLGRAPGATAPAAPAWPLLRWRWRGWVDGAGPRWRRAGRRVRLERFCRPGHGARVGG
ncbi:hypothetical protein, partial [Parafrankia sp. Ea1.12]|uniref:hypothetical protein n=1 Tax=Parafrankia sp. Ea1.12 TaxID=573499 RepID=UPI001F1D9DB1